MAWPFDNQGDTQSVLPIDYGVQQLAKYANQNLGNNRNLSSQSRGYENMTGTQAWPEYNPNLFKGMGVGHFDPRNLIRPHNLTQDLGASTYQAPPVYPGSAYSPHRGFEEMQFDETVQAPEKKGWSLPNFGITALMKKMIAPMSPEKRAEVEAIQGGADKYGWGNLPGTGLQGNVWQGSGGRKINVRDPVTGTQILRDKNLQSAFGSKTIADMIQKKEDWAKGQFEKYGDEWDDDEHRGLSTKLYNYYKSKGLIDKWKGPTPVDTTAGGTTIGEITGGAIQGGQGDYQRAPINRPDPSFSAPSTTGHMGPGGVHYAQGGRIGLYAGGDPEEPAENIFEIMQDQGVPFSEQVEGDPFDIRIQELMGKGLSYEDAYEIAEQEFQHLFSEGLEQDQGIASLV